MNIILQINFSVVVCRSDNNGYDRVYDSTVIGGQTLFVGSPWLFLASNGELQCYYDSEPLTSINGAPGSQWIAFKEKMEFKALGLNII